LLKGVALLGLEVAKLILYVKASLLAKIEQDLGIDVQLTCQLIDSYFLVWQALLLFGST